jgi:hypothetical protein
MSMSNADELLHDISHQELKINAIREAILKEHHETVNGPIQYDEARVSHLKDVLELEVTSLHARIISALEVYGQGRYLGHLEHRWDACLTNGFVADFRRGEEDYIDCPAADLLGHACSVLRDSIRREKHIQGREDQKDRARDAEGRRSHFLAVMALGLSSLISLIGNCDKMNCELHSAPTRRTSIYSGRMTAKRQFFPEGSVVTCDPPLEKVVVASGYGFYSITILPDCPRPLRLYCSASAPGYFSHAEQIDIPSEDQGPVFELPTLNLIPKSLNAEVPIDSVEVSSPTNDSALDWQSW